MSIATFWDFVFPSRKIFKTATVLISYTLFSADISKSIWSSGSGCGVGTVPSPTKIVPIIQGWTIQKYGTWPSSFAVHSYEPPAISNPVSNSPVGPSPGVPEVNVCAAESVFFIITLPPNETDVTSGKKQPSEVSSQPGDPEPFAVVIRASDLDSMVGSGVENSSIPTAW